MRVTMDFSSLDFNYQRQLAHLSFILRNLMFTFSTIKTVI